MKFLKIIAIVLIVSILLFTTYVILNVTHWSHRSYTDKSVYMIDLGDNSIKKALAYAKKRSDKLHSGGNLIFAKIFFYGKEPMRYRKGDFVCQYQIVNNNLLGLGFKYVVCTTKIEFNSNQIVSFRVGGLERGSESNNITEEDISKWTIDIDDAFDLAENFLGKEYLHKIKDPMGELLFYDDQWSFIITDRHNKRDAYIKIDPINGTAELLYSEL